jgi:tetratricopeptide (TPR) repeat protein
MHLPRLLTLIVLCVAIVAPAWTQRNWTRITTPHFVVFSEGSEKSGKELAVQLEQFRATLQATSPALRVDGSDRVNVIAFANDGSQDGFIANRVLSHTVYTGSRDQDFLFMTYETMSRLSHTAERGMGVNYGYSTYAYALQTLNMHRLPAWYVLGTVGFYSTFRIGADGRHAKVGRPLLDYAFLMRDDGFRIPLRQLFAEANVPRDSHEWRRFSAEAWALMHYLRGSDNGHHAFELSEFLNYLQAGKSPEQAAERAFGNFDQLQKNVIAYLKTPTLPYLSVTMPTAPATFTTERLTFADVQVLKARCALVMRQGNDAARLVQAALDADPKLADAYQLRGLLEFADGRTTEAAKSFDRAVALNPNLYLARYYGAMLRVAGRRTHEDERAVQTELRKVIALNPAYAPAYVALSTRLAQQPDTIAEALSLAAKAVQLDPSRLGYVLHLGRILLAAGNIEQAIRAGELVQARAEGTVSDSAAATLLLHARRCRERGGCTPPPISSYVPVPIHPDAGADDGNDDFRWRPALKSRTPKTLDSVSGTVAACEAHRGAGQLTSFDGDIRVGDETRRFTASLWAVRWPDTTWFDVRVARPCDVLPGARVTIAYTRNIDGTLQSDSIEVLEWGPPPASSGPVAASGK